MEFKGSMRSKIISRRTLIVVLSFALSLALLLHFISKSTPKSTSKSVSKSSIQRRSVPTIKKIVALPKKAPQSPGLPVRLRIPKINVDAAIEQVGLTSGRAMDTPKGPAEAGWFNLGPRPGNEGSAVIAGHSGWKNNIPAVFDNLEDIKPGDHIAVQDDKGAVFSFVVRESRRYSPKANASDVFASNDGKAHINLITCVGVWNTLTKSRSERLVVFADKE